MKHPSGYALIRRHLRRYPHALRQHLLQELNWLVTYEPVIGIMGKTGVGKSSLCNALFRSEVCTVNAVEACTRQPQRVRLRFGNHFLTLVDLPGVGESVTRDGRLAGLIRDESRYGFDGARWRTTKTALCEPGHCGVPTAAGRR